MTEADPLSRKIDALKEWQTIAWWRIVDQLTTAFERREIRNHMKECDAELRRCLHIMSEMSEMSERVRSHPRSVEEIGNSLANLEFRLFA